LSKIISAKKNVYFESVRFRDLEAGMGAEEGFFIRECPAEPKELEPQAEDTPAVAPRAEKTGEMPLVDVAAEREEAYNLGREQGYKQGRKEGRAEVEEELHSAAKALGDALEEISRMRGSLLAKSRDDMLRLVMAVSRQVIQQAVETDSQVIVRAVTRAIESAVESEEYYVRVHPEDLETVKANEPMFLAAMKGLENIHFIADENIARGGCSAESRQGDVDATIDTQLDKIEEHLRREIAG
jgi:flagellar assembly protein FliH